MQLQARVNAFFDEFIYPNEQRYYQEVAAGDRWQPTPLIEELKPQARAAGLWNLFLPHVGARRGADQPRIRAAVRDHGPRAVVAAKCSTARRPTPATWKCSSATAPPAHKAALARAAAGAARSARRSLMTEPAVASSDATNIQCTHRARRRRLRHQRPQVVVVRRRRPALQDLHRHGQDRPGRAAARAAVDDPRAARHARRHGPAARCRCSATTTRRTATWRSLFENVRVPAVEHPARRRPRLRDRAGPARARAASTTACARSAWPSARWS